MKRMAINGSSRWTSLREKAVLTTLPTLLNLHGKQRLSILIYHRVVATKDELVPGNPCAVEFDWQMRVLAECFQPLSLAEALSRMDDGSLPKRAACVTFDDGYADNESVALPILKKWGIPATIFIASGYLNGGRMWNDTVIEAVRTLTGKYLDLRELGLASYDLSSLPTQRSAIEQILQAIKHRPAAERETAVEVIRQAAAAPLPTDLMMSDRQIENLVAAGIEIGGHTVTHPILATLDEAAARTEILDNKDHLERLTGQQLRFFAYPNGRLGGDYELLHRDMVREAGYEAALSTHPGVTSAASDRWQLARFTPWDKTPEKFIARLLLNARQLVEAPLPSSQ